MMKPSAIGDSWAVNTAKTRAFLGALALVASCTQDRVVDPVTVTNLGPSGGIATSYDGLLTLSFPAGALPANTDIEIRAMLGSLQSSSVVSSVYQLSPSGLTFEGGVEIAIRASANGKQLAVVNLDGAAPVIVAGSSYDQTTGRAIATLEHFSSYGAMIIYDPCDNKACGDACTICDPSQSGCTEPPGAKVCDTSAACVLQIPPVVCSVQPDAGVVVSDAGTLPGVIMEVEPNDAANTAQPIQPDATIQGAISPAGDEDWYRIDVPGGLVATLEATTYTQLGDPSVCVGIDTELSLIDDQGNTIATNDDFGGTFCSQIAATLPGGTYYVRVTAFAGLLVSSYYLDINLTTGGTPDAGVAMDAGPFIPDSGLFPDAGPVPTTVIAEIEPNDTIATGQSVGTSTGTLTISGSITPAGDLDVFLFSVPLGATATLSAITYTQLGDTSICINADTYLTLYDAAGTVLAQNDDYQGVGCSLITSTLTGGDYALEVRHFAFLAGTIPIYYLDIDL